MIRPQDIIREYPLEHFLETAEQYYRAVTDPTPLMSKPFAYLHETPEMLQAMGLLLAGLRLGKTMTVLDFGAGVGWFSRFLAQLSCRTICCDASKTALDIGRRLFREHPPIGGCAYEPQFLPFDGRTIALPDESVDRIVCFDALHHVPNIEDVFEEFARVLRTGGLAGFSEPGPNHSQSPDSQYEMKNHRVLENDINLNEIFDAAGRAGFTGISCRLLCDMDISLPEYNAVFGAGDGAGLKEKIWERTRATMFNKTVFFLAKGEFRPDSRSHAGLAHILDLSKKDYSLRPGQPLKLSFRIANSGTARWLNANDQIYGIVRLGSHLYDGEGRLITVDHSRHDLPGPVEPGGTFGLDVEVALPGPGSYRLAFDLVAEGVTWFETVGSTPVEIAVTVK